MKEERIKIQQTRHLLTSPSSASGIGTSRAMVWSSWQGRTRMNRRRNENLEVKKATKTKFSDVLFRQRHSWCWFVDVSAMAPASPVSICGGLRLTREKKGAARVAAAGERAAGRARWRTAPPWAGLPSRDRRPPSPRGIRESGAGPEG